MFLQTINSLPRSRKSLSVSLYPMITISDMDSLKKCYKNPIFTTKFVTKINIDNPFCLQFNSLRFTLRSFQRQRFGKHFPLFSQRVKLKLDRQHLSFWHQTHSLSSRQHCVPFRPTPSILPLQTNGFEVSIIRPLLVKTWFLKCCFLIKWSD